MKKLNNIMEKQVKKLYRILFLVIVLLVPCVMLFGCGVKVQSLSFTEPTKTILVDETYKLEALSDPIIENLNITYSVADATIAYLLPNGETVLGLKEGQTKIYARSENGVIAEMTLSVVAQKSQLSTPTGFVFEKELSTLNWINVLNAYSYEVSVLNNGQTNVYEVFANSFCFDDFDLNYNEYTEYKFNVIAKPSPTSKIYLNSEMSDQFVLKQIYAVSNLTYSEGKIVFDYNLSSLNLEETGEILFYLEILKDSEYITRNMISSENLENNKINFSYVPNLPGEYTVRVSVSSENLQNSKTKEIKIIKFSNPLITTNGTAVLVTGESNSLFKYFKTINGVRQEVSVNDFIIGDLESGEEITYETYSYRQNANNIYYLDSEIVSFIVKKLETPENTKVEIINGDRNSVQVVWEALLPIENYDIYVNGKRASKTAYILENNLYKVILSNFEGEGIYKIYIVAHKNEDENIFYLNSENSDELTVVKLATPALEYDELSNKFILNSSQINIGATLNFYTNYKDQEFTLINGNISSEIKQFSLSGLNIDNGTCETISSVNRISDSDQIVYLESENSLFNVHKLQAPELGYIYSNEANGQIIVLWPEIQNVGFYLIQIKNITNNVLVTYSGSSIVQSNGIVSIVINVLEDGKDYEIYIKALPLSSNKTENGVRTQLIESEVSTLNISRLSSPNVEITGKGIGSINFAWESVENATEYEVYIDNRFVTKTTQLSYPISGMGFGEHSFGVVAFSSEHGVVASSSISNTNTVTYYVMDKIKNIKYEKASETQSTISFDQVLNAGEYKIIITDAENNQVTYTSFSLFNKRVYFSIPTADIFNKSGEYSIFAFAISRVENIVENSSTEKKITMLEEISSININTDHDYITWEYLGAIQVSGYEIYIDGRVITDYEFLDEEGLVQMQYYIADLTSGPHNITIITKGNNISTIDSLPFSTTVYKKENLNSPTVVGFRLKDSSIDSEFELTFNEVPNASYYVIYIADLDKNTIYSIQIDTLNEETITCLLNRNVFENDTLQYLYVRAFVVDDPIYANSVVPSFTDLSRVVKIYKSPEASVLNISNEETINLYGLQALINSQLYSNVNLSIPALASGAKLTFIVRNIGGHLDTAFNNTFYMASDWKNFEITKLENPIVNIDEGNKIITWGNSSTNNILNYNATIYFFGLDSILNATKNLTFAFNENSLTYNQIIDLIIENLNNEFYNYVGNYKIEIWATPIEQSNQKIYLSSAKSSVEFIISENLNNDLISGNILPEGIVELSFTKNNSYFISQIELMIQQGESSAILQLFLNGDYNIIGNSLNAFSNDIYYINEDNGLVYLYVDIQQVLNEGAFSINWKAIGDGIYVTSETIYKSITSYKLKTPILEYANDEYGNRIIIKEEVYVGYDEYVTVYANYNGEELAFTNGMLLLPYEWENISEIHVYAITNRNNTIMSDSILVDATLYNKITNIRLENENNIGNLNFDKTFLRWDGQDTETSWIVYIYHDQMQMAMVVGSNELELSSQILAYSGEYLFRVSAYGSEHLNSNLVDLTAVKLAPEITMSNTDGILNWTLNSSLEDKLSYFRIKIDANTKITHNLNTYTDTLQSYNGLLSIQMKLVGDVSKNIISSDYTGVKYFYKFNTPTTFKVKEGQFSFADEGDINVTNNLFRIKINETTYTYQDNGIIENISSFYSSNVNTGTAYAFIAGGDTIVIDSSDVLTLNSNLTSTSFSRLVVNSSNEEKWLNQADLGNGQIATYFNWNWIETGNITNRRVVIYIKPTNDIYATDIEGWTKVIKENNFLDYFSKTFDVSATYNGSTTSMSVVLELPKTLTSSSYVINVQKTDSSSGGIYLSSKLTTLIKFTQLARPILNLANGRLIWNNIPYATGFIMNYSGNLVGQKQLGVVSNFELDSTFKDDNDHRSYQFRIVALGNVPLEKVLVGDDHEYVVSSQTSSERSVVKPRAAGNLKLEDGGFKWNETYHIYRGSTAVLEFVVFNSASNQVARVEVDASVFDTLYPNKVNVLERYFPKAAFKAGESYTIKYRELGFSTCANSEYKDLFNNITGDLYATKVFKFAPTINEIKITNDGLSWRAISLPNGELTTINYDIFFKLENGSYIYATTIASTSISPRNSITMENIKSLGAFTNASNSNPIVGMFVAVRGDSKNYISGFNSAMVDVKVIQGSIGLYVEEGIIKWNNVPGAASYDIKTIINNETIVYKIYQEGTEYYLKKYVDEVLTLETILNSISLSNGIWSWEWAKDENIEANTPYDLYIRYIPQVGSGTFAIPGDYTTVALSVYKLASAQPSIINGNLSWSAIANAAQYKIFIKYLDSNGEILKEISFNTILTTLSLDIENIGTDIQIAVQAIGPDGSIDGRYYINPLIEYNTVKYKTSTVTNFRREGDIIKWNDNATNSYEIVVYDSEGNLKGSYITSSQEYNLSSLNLSSLLDYVVCLKVRGTTGTVGAGGTGYLSSIIINAGITFKVLPEVEYIDTSNGEMVWEITNQNEYRVTISGGGNIFVYTIGLVNSEYKVLGLTRNGFNIQSKSNISKYINGVKTYIKFWPAEIDEQISFACSIIVVGAERGEDYYVSSKSISLGSTVIKMSSNALEPAYIYDPLTSTFTFTWRKYTGYIYDIVIEKLDGTPVYLETALTLPTLNYISSTLESGTYRFKVQRYSSDPDSIILKSNYAEIQFEVSNESQE